MAVPTPQTPSSKYAINDVANVPIFVELLGNKFLTVVGAASVSQIDLPFYDGGSYRDVVDSSLLGRAAMSVVQSASSLNPVVNSINGDLFIGDTGTLTPRADQIATMMEQDDNFSHTPPHPELKARSLVQWWDTTGAAGKEVARAWLDTIVGTSSRIPQSNGSAPPLYTP